MRDPFSVQAPSNRREGSFHARLAAGMALLLLVLVACGQAAASSPISTTSLAPVQSSTPSTSFPVTLTDDEGTSVVIPKSPQRIISLAPSNTEIVFALGAGQRLLAGTDADDYPAEASALPDVVVETKLLKEQIVALRPDLILAYGNGFTPPADITQLRALGYPVLVAYASSLATAKADIQLVGAAIGAGEKADSIVATINARFDEIKAAVPAGKRPRTFYEVGYGPGIYTPSADSAYAEMIKLAGGDPITTDASFTISLEALVKADPEVILLGDAAYGVCPDQIATRSGWATMTAVKNGAIKPVNDTVVTRPGPRLPQGLASLAQAIHPDIGLSLGLLPTDPPLCPSGPGATPTPGPAVSP